MAVKGFLACLIAEVGGNSQGRKQKYSFNSQYND